MFSLCRGLENVTRSGLENGPLLFMQPPRLCFCYTFDNVEKADLLLYTVYAHLSQRKCSQAPTGALPFSIPPIKCGFGSQILATINTSSVWSTLIIAMNSHLFIAMINVDHADDVLIIAVDQVHLKILFVAVIKATHHWIFWDVVHHEDDGG